MVSSVDDVGSDTVDFKLDPFVSCSYVHVDSDPSISKTGVAVSKENVVVVAFINDYDERYCHYNRRASFDFLSFNASLEVTRARMHGNAYYEGSSVGDSYVNSFNRSSYNADCCKTSGLVDYDNLDVDYAMNSV